MFGLCKGKSNNVFDLDFEYPQWLNVAYGELGVKEIPGYKHEPKIIDYHASVTLLAEDDETPWCSSFVNWCMENSGFVGTDKANARSWLKWGHEMTIPAFGCVVVLSRGNPNGWQGHVGFYVGKSGKSKIKVLGGNQGNKVSIKSYSVERVLGYRWI